MCRHRRAAHDFVARKWLFSRALATKPSFSPQNRFARHNTAQLLDAARIVPR
jgi:hypothetical protein